jgi:hypothetical protein
MRKMRLLFIVSLVLLLVACGQAVEPEPAAVPPEQSPAGAPGATPQLVKFTAEW